MDSLKKAIQDLELSLRKAESEKNSKDHQIKSLQEEMGNQDELVAKLNKEMKHQGECSKKLMEDLQGEEDKVNHLNKVKAKLDAQVESVSRLLTICPLFAELAILETLLYSWKTHWNVKKD